MASNTAISDVGVTLVSLLENKMGLTNKQIVLGSPGEIKEDLKISLFLFQIIENVHMKNKEMQPIDSDKLKYPPLTLDLYYMLTAHPSQETTDKTMHVHSILGQAMQVFYDNAILEGPYLKGSLSEYNEELHITLNPMSLEDITNIWNTFHEKPFKPSVCYVVTPVNIDSDRKLVKVSRIVSKKIDYDAMVPTHEV